MTIAPYRMYFGELLDQNPGRVCDRLPIMCFEDRAESPDHLRGYVHADFMSLYIARKGHGIHLVDEVPSQVQAGDVYAMGLGMSHRFMDSDQLVLDTVHFLPTMFSPETLEALSLTEGVAPLFLGNDAEASRWLHLNAGAHLQVLEMLREMREEWYVDAPDRALMVQAIFLRLLVFLARCHRSVHKSGSRVVTRARALIEHRYAEPLRIGDIAASAFLSTGRFSELFRAEVGCSPRDYLGQVRIHEAKKLLLETDLTVATVAARTGFADPAYFTRFFRQQVGICPSDFREDEALASPGML